MKKVIIVGAGGHAAELHYYINYKNENTDSEPLTIHGFIDDDEAVYHEYNYEEPFLGTIKDHKIVEGACYLMGIANVKYRRTIIESMEKKGAEFTGFIHPTALIAPSANIGKGVVISHNASVGPKVTIGNHNMLNSRCTIGHDTKIGDYNFISPQAAIAGNTKIGDENMLGTNSCTIPGMTIGNNNKIAAGMVVYKPVSNGETVLFRHKERLIIKEK